MEELITPLFAHNEPGPRYQVHEAARFMARPGLSEEKAATQLRRFAKERWVHVRGKIGSGPTASNIYAPSDIGAAIVVSAILDTGIADRKVMNAASLALYAWQPGQHPQGHHPITFATWCASDNEWCFDIRILRDTRTGKGPVANFFRPVCELPEKAIWPNFWLWTGLPDGRVSTHGWADVGSAGRNPLVNRPRKNFATSPKAARPVLCGGRSVMDVPTAIVFNRRRQKSKSYYI
jgi:hypothetical protein